MQKDIAIVQQDTAAERTKRAPACTAAACFVTPNAHDDKSARTAMAGHAIHDVTCPACVERGRTTW